MRKTIAVAVAALALTACGSSHTTPRTPEQAYVAAFNGQTPTSLHITTSADRTEATRYAHDFCLALTSTHDYKQAMSALTDTVTGDGIDADLASVVSVAATSKGSICPM